MGLRARRGEATGLFSVEGSGLQAEGKRERPDFLFQRSLGLRFVAGSRHLQGFVGSKHRRETPRRGMEGWVGGVLWIAMPSLVAR